MDVLEINYCYKNPKRGLTYNKMYIKGHYPYTDDKQGNVNVRETVMKDLGLSSIEFDDLNIISVHRRLPGYD